MISNTPAAQGKALPRLASARSRAFTLIEMLVSLTITLMMMGAVVSLFGLITDSVSGSRAIIETSERLRATRNRLQADLIGATATMTPPLRPESDEGYFEYIEGPSHDSDFARLSPPSMFGDADDVLMFTVRSRGEPFVGKFNATTTESQMAEVMYFAVQNGPIVDAAAGTKLSTLYRRVLLVAPGTRVSMPAVSADYYDKYDVSARIEMSAGAPVTYYMVPNSLGDLTKRENRFAHYNVFPFHLNATAPVYYPSPYVVPPTFPNKDATLAPFDAANTPSRFGDDVLLTNVLAFDVQIYDSNAPIQTTGVVPVTSTDAGFSPTAPSTTPVGAYVDLGYPFTGSATYTPLFRQAAQRSYLLGGSVYLTPTLPFGTTATSYTYDTWSLHYENDGVLQNTNAGHVTDGGTNGLDDNNDGVVDDATEFETQAPYAAQMRGIRVIIRVYEPSSQQVREVTVVQDFLPE